MTQETLLYVIAISTAINALAWIAVLLIGLRLYREVEQLKREISQQLVALVDELLALTRESKEMVRTVRGLTGSGQRIAEQVLSAVLIRRVAPSSAGGKVAVKSGLKVARQGVGMLRKWLKSKGTTDGSRDESDQPLQLEPKQEVEPGGTSD